MSESHPNLLETFNAAAQAAVEEKLPLPLFVTHYLTAMRHGTSDADEKRSLTKTIFDAVHNKLDYFASPGGIRATADLKVKETFVPLLDAMCTPECIDFLPHDAAQKLASIVFKASETAAKVTYDSFTKWEHFEPYQTHVAALSQLALVYADAISKPRPEASVETSKDIAPVKRITLKPAEGTQP
ncbi:MAG: hypothetical protein ACAH80_12470 [Alphaproteobacteria bacterium]